MKKIIFLIIFNFLISACASEDLPQPPMNKVSAQMAINGSNSIIKIWQDTIENETLSEDEILKLKNNIESEKLWIKDMQFILEDKKPSGEGIKQRREIYLKELGNLTVNSPTYCNIKNLLNKLEKLERGESVGQYSCD